MEAVERIQKVSVRWEGAVTGTVPHPATIAP